MLSWLASFLSGPIVNGLIGAYKAKLEAGNTSERIAAGLAARELAVEQREREVATQVIIADRVFRRPKFGEGGSDFGAQIVAPSGLASSP